MKMTGPSEKFLFVAAIDFGTTYSGYAYSSRDDYLLNPLKIHFNVWSGDSLQSRKAPTCVLFDPHKNFSNFGYEAEDKYASLASGEETGQNHQEWFFFRRFKMTLFGKINLQRRYMLKDETGKEMPALDVFSAAIGYLKNHLIARCRKSVTSIDENTDIRWVLTVPAIWSDASKQFMREAANIAGIKNDNLLIALEPEAASICCRHQPLHKMDNDGKTSIFESFVPGSKYLVLDAGGGTVDTTVHEVEESGKLSELYVANGGNWGGIYVDQAFRRFLISIVGDNIIEHMQIYNTGDLLYLLREFEIKKRNFRERNTESIQFRAPIVISTLFEEKTKQKLSDFVAAKFPMQGKCSWVADKLQIDAATAEGFFNCVCESIADHLETMFNDREIDGVPIILMVGGFSETPMFQEIIRERFKNKTIIIPAEPDIAVLKGAVIFGHEPTVIEQRCCRKTYGVQIVKAFREGKDPEEHKFTNASGLVCCKKRFSKHVEIGQTVKVGEHYSISYRPTNSHQKTAVVQFFASSQPSPEYINDSGCYPVGSLAIDIDGWGMDRSVEVKMIFGWTELVAMATDMKSGHQVKTTLNFLG